MLIQVYHTLDPPTTSLLSHRIAASPPHPSSPTTPLLSHLIAASPPYPTFSSINYLKSSTDNRLVHHVPPLQPYTPSSSQPPTLPPSHNTPIPSTHLPNTPLLDLITYYKPPTHARLSFCGQIHSSLQLGRCIL